MASNQLQDRQVRGEHCPLFPLLSLWFSSLPSLVPCDVRHPHAPTRPYIRDLPRTATSQSEREREDRKCQTVAKGELFNPRFSTGFI